MSLQQEAEYAVTRCRAAGTDLYDVEAKSARGGIPRKLERTISAFANGEGGLLLLGVSEDTGFVPVEVDAGVLADQVASICLDKVQPPVRPEIDIVNLEGHAVVAVQVAPAIADDKPVYVKSLGVAGGSFIRTHDGNRLLNAFEVHALLSAHGQPQDDLDPVPDLPGTAPAEDATQALVRRIRVHRPALQDFADGQVLQMLGVRQASGDDGGSFLTLGGALALGRYPQEALPQLNITFVVYPTADGMPLADGIRFLDNESIDGPIPVLLSEALRVIRRNIKVRARITGLLREDVPEYPEEALREVIVNALLHREYAPMARGTQVRIEMYPDRLEITSPGGLFGGVAESELMSEPVSSSRNAHLAKLLEDVEVPGTGRTVCENRGSGLLATAASLRRAGMQPPEIRSDLTSFKVILRNHTLMDEETLGWLSRHVEGELTDQQKLGLALARHKSEITNSEYRALTGADAATASRDLARIAETGWLERQGGRRFARWVFVEGATSQAHVAIGDPDATPGALSREAALLALMAEGPASAGHMADQIDVSRPVVLKELRNLEARGLVQPTSDKINSPRNQWRLVDPR